jgi:catechol 2,3-dioxygenase-like lactoylglutathione lyase family enzyme
VARFTRITPRLPVADLRRTIPFYTQTLGFRVAVLWPRVQPTFCILDRDQVSVSFYMPDEHRPTVATGAGELSIDVEDVRGLHAALKDKVAVEWGPEVYFYGRREFAIRDPNGYLLIFSEKTNDPPTSTEE